MLKSVDKVVYGKKSIVPGSNTLAFARAISIIHWISLNYLGSSGKNKNTQGQSFYPSWECQRNKNAKNCFSKEETIFARKN